MQFIQLHHIQLILFLNGRLVPEKPCENIKNILFSNRVKTELGVFNIIPSNKCLPSCFLANKRIKIYFYKQK